MVEIPEWLHGVDEKLLPEQHKRLADMVGVDGMLAFVSAYSGTYFYVPKLDALIRSARDRLIRKDYNEGVDPKVLAHKYDLSVVQVYSIIKDTEDPNKDQCSLFDEDLNT